MAVPSDATGGNRNGLWRTATCHRKRALFQTGASPAAAGRDPESIHTVLDDSGRTTADDEELKTGLAVYGE